MGIKNWFLSLNRRESPMPYIGVGTRVMTPHGAGTVSGGQLNIDLDAGTKLRPLSTKCPRVNVSHALDNIQPVT